MNRLLAALAVLATFACSTANAPGSASEPAATSEVPITSKSPEAIEYFKKGRDLADNARAAEAVVELNRAIGLDPDFALALAYRGSVTPGARGMTDLEQASAKAAKASNAERLFIDATLAGARGEFAKSESLWAQLTDAAPGDWRAYVGRGQQYMAQEKYREASEILNKAAAINPKAGPVYNMLGYVHLQQEATAPAVEALKRYADINANEPNPHDSLGEAMMAAGDLSGAEAEFRKALEISPGFDIAWQGVAYTKLFRSDWAGGKEALAEARKARRPVDRAQVDILSAFASLGQGNGADALKQFNALLTSADATTVDQAFVPLYRAIVAIDGARYADAIAESDRAMASGSNGKLPSGAAAVLRRWALTTHAAADGLSYDVAGAEKSVAALQKEASARPDDPSLQSAVHFGLGMLAVAQKDMKSARGHFDQCTMREFYCHSQALVASRKAGDREGADASRARLVKMYLRDPIYLHARLSADRVTPRRSNSN